MFSEIMARILASDFLPALLGAGGAGAILYYIRSIPAKLYSWFTKVFLFELQYRSDNKAFRNAEYFLQSQKFKFSRRFAVTSSYYDNDKESLLLTNGTGKHIFFYKKKLVITHRQMLDRQGTNEIVELLDFTILFGNKKIIDSLSTDINNCLHEVEGVKVFYVSASYCLEWKYLHTLPFRTMDSIHLPENQKQEIIDDIDEYYMSHEGYTAKGVPHRRCYLFEGLPGTGKTSFIHALATKYKASIYVCSLQNITEAGLVDLFASLPKNAFLLIEDIDSFASIRERKTKTTDKLSFSALLNVLDGLLANGNQRVLFLTTNKANTLDSALLRPGRIDKRMEFTYCTWNQIVSQYKYYYGNENIESTKSIWDASTQEFTTSELQQLYLIHKKSEDDFISGFTSSLKPKE